MNRPLDATRHVARLGLPFLATLWLLTTASSSNAQPPVPPPPPGGVRIINTPANPVPVVQQGTASVSGTVTITGNPGVNVVNSPTVQVGNDATRPIPVAAQGTQEVSVAGATRSFAFGSDVPGRQEEFIDLEEPILLSTLSIFVPDDLMLVTLIGLPGSGKCEGDQCVMPVAEGRVELNVVVRGVADPTVLSFPEPIPLATVRMRCIQSSSCTLNAIYGVGRAIVLPEPPPPR